MKISTPRALALAARIDALQIRDLDVPSYLPNMLQSARMILAAVAPVAFAAFFLVFAGRV